MLRRGVWGIGSEVRCSWPVETNGYWFDDCMRVAQAIPQPMSSGRESGLPFPSDPRRRPLQYDDGRFSEIRVVLRERLGVMVESPGLDLLETGLIDSIGLVELILE